MKHKIYIVATEVPSLRGGAAVRNLNIIKQYIAHGYDVSLFCIASEKDTGEIKKISDIGLSEIFVIPLPQIGVLHSMKAIIFNRVPPYMLRYKMSALGETVAREAAKNNPHFIQFEQTNAYYAVGDQMDSLSNKATTLILDAHNVEQVAFEHSLKTFGVLKRLVGRYVLSGVKRTEDSAGLHADTVLCCSDEDRRYFETLGAKSTTVVPNGVDCVYFSNLSADAEQSLLFMGGTGYPPNDQALRWYFSDIHAELKHTVPDVKIYILGGTPPDWLKQLAERDSSIQLPGYVEDVREYIAKASVCISPMLGGSGTSLKILEYMASMKPVVSTTHGARGIACKDGYNIVLTNDSSEFAQKIASLLQSKKKRISLSEKARELMLEAYDWSGIGAALHSHLVDIKTSEV